MAPENPHAQRDSSNLSLRKSGRPMSTPPSATELQNKLDGLRNERSTPSTDKKVPSPLHGQDAKAGSNGDGTRSDSGYASLASSLSSSPHPSKGRADRAELTGSQSGTSGLKFLDKPIPQELRDRFFDLKMLYSGPLWKAVSKNKANPGDMSMKLKYMGDDEGDEQLCIIVHCEKGVAKKVKKFFAQEHVREDLSPDFQVRIISKGLLRLATSSPAAVYGGSTPRTTLCGTPIEVKGENGSSFATIGGLIIASMNDKTTIYGLTAGHPLANIHEDCPESPPSLDEDDDDESDQDAPEDDDFIQLLEIDDSGFGHDDFGSVGQKLSHLGTIQDFCLQSSFAREGNRDWALISIPPKEWLPNFLVAATDQGQGDVPRNGETSDGQPPSRNLFCSPTMPSLSSPQRVVIMTGRGFQQGTVMANHSSILMTPGEFFVDTLDFLPSTGSRLQPGDSGSWAVDEGTGEVFGHVVSVDVFGEAYVMPIQDTLQDIRSHLQARHVELPSQLDAMILRKREAIHQSHSSRRTDAAGSANLAQTAATLTQTPNEGGAAHGERPGERVPGGTAPTDPAQRTHNRAIFPPMQEQQFCHASPPSQPSFQPQQIQSGILQFTRGYYHSIMYPGAEKYRYGPYGALLPKSGFDSGYGSAASSASSSPQSLQQIPSPPSRHPFGYQGSSLGWASANSGFATATHAYQRHNFPPVNPADQNPPCNTLYVGNMPIDTSEEELRELFSKQKGFKRLCFRMKQNGPMCFVEFEDVSFATKALHELYDSPLKNSTKRGIRLSFSKNPLGVRSGQSPAPGTTPPGYPTMFGAPAAYPGIAPSGRPVPPAQGPNGLTWGNLPYASITSRPPPELPATPDLGSNGILWRDATGLSAAPRDLGANG